MNFNLYSQYYDLLYKDKPYKEEAAYVFKTLTAENASPIKNVLELGCGSGNHAHWLTQMGWNITGIEKSEEMVTLAKSKKIDNFLPIHGDITNITIDKQYDAAISLFHVISYLNSNDEINNCFSSVNRHLSIGGLFLFDVWFTPGVYSQKPETRIKRMENDKVQIIRLAESDIHYDTNVVDVHYEIIARNKENNEWSSFTETHCMRHFSIPEIKILAAFHGFDIVQMEEFITHNKPSDNTWAVCFILKKIKDV